MILLGFHIFLIASIGSILKGLVRERSWGTAFIGLLRFGLFALIGIGLGMILFALTHSAPSWALFFGLRLLAWALFLYVPLYLLGVVWTCRVDLPRLALTCLICVGLIGATAIYSFLIEPYNLELRRYQISSDKITESMKIIVLADIQTDNPASYEARVLELVMEEKPDLILFTGDYIQHRRVDRYHELQLVLNQQFREAGLSAPLGTFAVQGDEGGFASRSDWVDVFADLPIEALSTTTSIELDELSLTGLSFWDSANPNLEISGDEKFKIVFGHRPDFSLGNVDADLLIAGHTHGGQVQLPLIGPLFIASGIPASWGDGFTRLSPESALIVSRGIGMERNEAPRLRFLCRPELTIIELEPAS
jgi:hypothetical protein